MRARGVILYTGGILGGWWIAASPATSSAVEKLRVWSGGEKMEAAVVPGEVLEGLPRRDDGQVLVSAERLQELLENHGSPVLRADDFAGGRHQASLDLLAKWLGLNAGSKDRLAGILRGAAEERFAWEKANARITKPAPHRWVLEIPGDGGASRAALLEELKDGFGEQAAETIALAADLEGFFELPRDPYAKESPSGPIEIEAAKFEAGDGDNETGELFVRIGEGNTSILRPGQDPIKGVFLTRVGHLLPGYEEMDRLARRVPLPPRKDEGDSFESPFD